jgi:hypothetical protein
MPPKGSTHAQANASWTLQRLPWQRGRHLELVHAGFGPLRQFAESLPPDRAERLKRDIGAYHSYYAAPAGVHMKREYLLTIGRRR